MTALLAREIQESMRSRWFLAMTAVFCAMALGISYLSFSGTGALGFAGFNRTVASLLNLMLLGALYFAQRHRLYARVRP